MHSCKPVGLICLCIDGNVSCNLYIDLHLVLYLSHQTYGLSGAIFVLFPRAMSQARVLAHVFDECREGQIPRCLRRGCLTKKCASTVVASQEELHEQTLFVCGTGGRL